MDKLLAEITYDDFLYNIKNYVPSAWIGHAPILKFVIRELKPKTFVELGTHNGFSYFVGAQAIKETGISCKSWAVDHWQGDAQAGFFDNNIFDEVVQLNSKYAEFSTLLKMSFNEALNNFDNGSIDLLHIDGYHSYQSVKEDFENWLPKMSLNGIILFHDIHVRRDGFGVFKLWAELKNTYKTIEFTGSHGLGILFIGEIPNGKLQQITEIAQNGDLIQVQGVFGSISDDVIQKYRHLVEVSLQQELNKVEVSLQQELNKVKEVSGKLNLIENSTIWKATSMLRKLVSLLKRN